MNRWEMFFSRGALLLYMFSVLSLVLLGERADCSSNIRQRSDGCGPHPLIALAAASRPFGSNGVGSLNDVLRAVRADPVVWPVMQNLLRRYDDCIRAADGLHYKRSDDSTVGGGRAAAAATVPTASSEVSLSSSGGSGRIARLKSSNPNSNSNNALLQGTGTGRSIFVSGGFSASPDPTDMITTGSDILLPWFPSPI